MYSSSEEDESTILTKKGKMMIELILKEFKDVMCSASMNIYFILGAYFDISKF
jgi:hypothetical protein